MMYVFLCTVGREGWLDGCLDQSIDGERKEDKGRKEIDRNGMGQEGKKWKGEETLYCLNV